MKKKLLLLWLLAASLLIALGGAVYLASRPSPIRAGYERIQMGMSATEVESVMPRVASICLGEKHTIRSIVYEDFVAGELYRMRFPDEGRVLEKLFAGPDVLTTPLRRQWQSDCEHCYVWYDERGRVAEKLYVDFYRSPWDCVTDLVEKAKECLKP